MTAGLLLRRPAGKWCWEHWYLVLCGGKTKCNVLITDDFKFKDVMEYSVWSFQKIPSTFRHSAGKGLTRRLCIHPETKFHTIISPLALLVANRDGGWCAIQRMSDLWPLFWKKKKSRNICRINKRSIPWAFYPTVMGDDRRAMKPQPRSVTTMWLTHSSLWVKIK